MTVDLLLSSLMETGCGLWPTFKQADDSFRKICWSKVSREVVKLPVNSLRSLGNASASRNTRK